jgi:hypothetical protein
MLPQVAHHPRQLSQEFGNPGFAGPPFETRPSPRRPDRLTHIPFRSSKTFGSSSTLVPPHRAFPVESHGSQRPGVARSSFLGQGFVGQYNDPSEHMLRRKTPNGTLAAGYDGTPIQWSSKAPALKHVVLPISETSSFQNGANAGSQVDDRLSRQRSSSLNWNYQSSSQFGVVNDADGERRLNNDMGNWTYLPSLSNPSHNVLDHISTHQAATYSHNNGMQIPTVLQPAYQPSPGPTASNDGGFYGPYWPDGRFVPYRPAAFRDQGPHYPIHGLNFSRGLQHQSKPAGDGLQGFRQTSHSIGLIQRARNASLSITDNISHRPDIALGLQMQSQPIYANATLYSINPEGSRTPSGQSVNRASNTRFKEKTLSWAHSIYIDLLAFLHQSKKENKQARQSQGFRHYSKNSIYPKPPRQPASNFGISNWAGLYPSADENDATTLGGNISSILNQGPNGANLGGYLAGWQSTGALGDTRHARFSNSDVPHYVSPFHASHHPAGSPLSKAKEALEMLTNLCEQSSWCWIDGMLLGGCLAYGLEEYHKALDWYSKIIDLDPK